MKRAVIRKNCSVGSSNTQNNYCFWTDVVRVKVPLLVTVWFPTKDHDCSVVLLGTLKVTETDVSEVVSTDFEARLLISPVDFT